MSKENLGQEFDEFTGAEAQADKEFLSEGGDYSSEGLTELEQIEASLANDDFDDEEQLQGLDYESFVILKKQDLLKFLRAVEPWVKTAVDQYGKCVRVRSTSKEEVEFSYINGPMALTAKVINRSGKTIPQYFIQVSTLKRIVTETYASLVLVHENDELNIALLNNILFVETVNLNEEEYEAVKLETEQALTRVDVDALALLTKKLSFVLAATDRVAEKVVNFKDDKAYISTAVFAAKVRNPFEFGDMSISKIGMDLLGILTEVSKLAFNAVRVENSLLVEVDGLWRAVIPVFKLDNVLIDKASEVTGFKGTMEVSNDELTKLVDVVKSFEYLSEVLEFKVGKDLEVNIRSKDLTRKVSYNFPYTGQPETTDEVIRVSAAIVKPYLHLGGDTTQYAFTKYGWGLQTEWGELLIRRTV